MCNDSRTKLEETESGNILITIDPYDVWNLLSLEQKEQVINDRGMWYIIEQEMKWELEKGVSSDNFMSSLQRFREMLSTNQELVSGTVVACIKQLLEDKASAIQKQREADQAFWRLRNAVNDHFRDIPYSHRPEWAQNIESNYDINKNDDYMRFSTNDVKDEVLKAFFATIDMPN